MIRALLFLLCLLVIALTASSGAIAMSWGWL